MRELLEKLLTDEQSRAQEASSLRVNLGGDGADQPWDSIN